MKSFVFAGAPYSNSAPLMDKLTEVDPRVRVVNDHPAKLVRDLNTGKADVALIPVVHLFCHPELIMLEGLGVASDGPVRSVLLKCNRPVGQIKTVARDPASATSNALAELVLKKHFKQSIEMHDFKSLEHPDATVMIGDPALCADPASAGDIDLADVWKKMTKLPFVFAVWSVRKDFSDIDIVSEIVHRAYASGVQDRGRIAERYAGQLGGSQAFWLDYLDHSVHYKLNRYDLEGMEEFRRLFFSECSNPMGRNSA